MNLIILWNDLIKECGVMNTLINNLKQIFSQIYGFAIYVMYAQGLLSEWNLWIKRNLKRNCIMNLAVVTDTEKYRIYDFP